MIKWSLKTTVFKFEASWPCLLALTIKKFRNTVNQENKKYLKRKKKTSKQKREATFIILSKSSLGSIYYFNDLLSGGPLV